MPQKATVELTAKVGKETFADKSEFEIGPSLFAPDERICACETRTILLGSEKSQNIKFLMLRADNYRPKEENGCPTPEGRKKQYVRFRFNGPEGGRKMGAANGDGFVALEHGLFIAGGCVEHLLPEELNSITIQNDLPVDVNVSILIARVPSSPNGNGSACQAQQAVPLAPVAN